MPNDNQSMHPIIDDELATRASTDLSANDADLAKVITRYGVCPIRPHSDYYKALVRSVIGQQLSVKAADSITRRFVDHYESNFPAPQQIIDTDLDTLRSLGLSRAKSLYIQDLAQRITDGSLGFSHFNQLSNAQIIAELTAVKGIGEWTAHIFLMFCMGRADVLPYGDLGVRSGIQKLYGLETLPDRILVEKIAASNRWHPYETIASWYIWQSLDNAPVTAS